MAFGSEIERIASNAAYSSGARSSDLANLVSMFASMQRQQPSFRGPRSTGPPGGMTNNIKNFKTKGIRPGVHGPIRPNAKIVTIRDRQGHSVQVNKSVADEFSAFLRALKRTGYKVHSIGGYANRNIAGTSTRSLHSYGLAIDINPGANPVTYGRRQTNLPRGIGRLARRYGLAWGGNWKGGKKDTMHFSFPFFGTK